MLRGECCEKYMRLRYDLSKLGGIVQHKTTRHAILKNRFLKKRKLCQMKYEPCSVK